MTFSPEINNITPLVTDKLDTLKTSTVTCFCRQKETHNNIQAIHTPISKLYELTWALTGSQSNIRKLETVQNKTFSMITVGLSSTPIHLLLTGT